MNYTAVVVKQDDWWLGWIEEIPGVNCQEKSKEELLASLQTTLREALDLNKQDALAEAGEVYTEEIIAV